MFVNSSARVYSCREQSDAALISNYDLAGMEEVVNVTRPAVRNKMIHFLLPTKSSYSSVRLRILI